MASFNDCVDIAFKAGRISKDVAETIKAADNPDAAIDGILGDLSRQKREAAIQAVRIAEGFENIKSHPVSMYDGLVSLLTKDPTGQAPYKNVEYTAKNFSAKYQGACRYALGIQD